MGRASIKKMIQATTTFIKCVDDLARVKIALLYFCLPSASSKEAGQEEGDSPTDRV